MQKISTMAWSKLFKKKLYTNIEEGFPEGKNHEDCATICKILYSAKNVAASKEPLYCVNTTNENSICHTRSYKNLDDSIWAGFERARFFNEKKELELAKFAWNYAGGELINSLISYPMYKRLWKHYKKEFLAEAEASPYLKNKVKAVCAFPRLYGFLKGITS